MRKKVTTWHAVVYFLCGFALFLVLAGWIFFQYYYEDLLNAFVIPKLQEATISATHGYYRLNLKRISYRHHRVYAAGFDLYRVKYDSGARGTAVKRVSIDTLEITGVNLWKIYWGKALALRSIEMDSPEVYFADLENEKPTTPDPTYDSLKIVKSSPIRLPLISFDSIALRDIQVYTPTRKIEEGPSYKGIAFRLTDFSYNSETKEAQPVLFSRRADIAIPDVTYPIGDSTYSLSIKNLRGNSEDSLITVDSFAYFSNYSQDQYAARHKYTKSMMDISCKGIQIEGVNFPSALTQGGIVLRNLKVNSWNLISYQDNRKPVDPNPGKSMMPNEGVSTIPTVIAVDSIILNRGRIRISERGAAGKGTLGFDKVNITVTPIIKDTLTPSKSKPSNIHFAGYFEGEGLLDAYFSYPLFQKDFDMDVRATVGAFGPKRLNEWLVPMERVEITEGTISGGKIGMTVRNGTAQVTATPVYHNFKLRFLNAVPGKKPGFMKKVMTFLARLLVFDKENPEPGKITVGTATHVRAFDESFTEFLWNGLRTALGKVVVHEEIGKVLGF